MMLRITSAYVLLPTLIGMLLLAGCATPNPAATYASQGRKFYGKGLIPDALDSFNRSADYDAKILAGKRYAKHRVMYEDCQLQYGLEKAKSASEQGNLIEALAWYRCVALINAERAECVEARKEADRVAGELPEVYLAKAKDALEQGDKIGAYEWSMKTYMATGNDEAGALLDQIASAIPFDGQAMTRPVPFAGTTIQPPVRTDLLTRVTGRTSTMVGGVHVFFGEPVAYYEALDTTRVEGYPNGVLWILAARAKKKGGDALVNVSVQHKGETAVTSATIAKLLHPETEGVSP